MDKKTTFLESEKVPSNEKEKAPSSPVPSASKVLLSRAVNGSPRRTMRDLEMLKRGSPMDDNFLASKYIDEFEVELDKDESPIGPLRALDPITQALDEIDLDGPLWKSDESVGFVTASDESAGFVTASESVASWTPMSNNLLTPSILTGKFWKSPDCTSPPIDPKIGASRGTLEVADDTKGEKKNEATPEVAAFATPQVPTKRDGKRSSKRLAKKKATLVADDLRANGHQSPPGGFEKRILKEAGWSSSEEEGQE